MTGGKEHNIQVGIISHNKDGTLAQNLRDFLRGYQRATNFTIWSDSDIFLGEMEFQITKKNVSNSHILVILLSLEMTNDPSLEKIISLATANDTTIVPVLARPCVWDVIPFVIKFRLYPKFEGEAIPISMCQNPENVLRKLSNEIYAHIINNPSTKLIQALNDLNFKDERPYLQKISSFKGFTYTLIEGSKKCGQKVLIRSLLQSNNQNDRPDIKVYNSTDFREDIEWWYIFKEDFDPSPDGRVDEGDIKKAIYNILKLSPIIIVIDNIQNQVPDVLLRHLITMNDSFTQYCNNKTSPVNSLHFILVNNNYPNQKYSESKLNESFKPFVHIPPIKGVSLKDIEDWYNKKRTEIQEFEKALSKIICEEDTDQRYYFEDAVDLICEQCECKVSPHSLYNLKNTHS